MASNAYQEALKVAQQAAREATVRLPLNILQDILAELRQAKAEIEAIRNQPVDRVSTIVTKLKRDG